MKMRYQDQNKGIDELYFIGEYNSEDSFTTFFYGSSGDETGIYVEKNGSGIHPIEEEDREDLMSLLSKDENALDRFKRYMKEEKGNIYFKDKKRSDKPWLVEIIQSLL